MIPRSPISPLLTFGTALLLSHSGGATTGPWQRDGPATVRLISPWDAAPSGGELALGFEVTLKPGWHIYWRNSGDAGYPPRFDFSATPGATDAELHFPVPHRYELPGNLVAFGYGGQVVYPITLRGRFGAGASLPIATTVDYVVCAGECIPFTTALTLDQPFAGHGEADETMRPLLAAWRARVPSEAPEGTVTASAMALDVRGGRLELAFSSLPAAPKDLYFAPHELVEIGRPQGRKIGERSVFEVPFAWKVRHDAPPKSLALDWTIAFGESGWSGVTTASLASDQPAPAGQGSPARAPAPTRLSWPWLVVLAATAAGLVWALWPRAKSRPGA